MAGGKHVDEATLVALLKGHLKDNGAVVEHLLSGCQECEAKARRAWEFHGEVRQLDRHGLVGKLRQWQARVEQERAQAETLPALVFRGKASPKEGRRPRRVSAQIELGLRNLRRFQTPAAVEWLLERSDEERFSAPALTLEYAELAVTVAECLDPDELGALACDYQARAYSHVGNARRILSEYEDAEEQFATAVHLLEQGTGDPLEEARVTTLRAALEVDLNRFHQALAMQKRAQSLFQEGGDEAWATRMRIERGRVLLRLEEPGRAVPLLERALEVVTPREDLAWHLIARHSLAWALHLTDESRRALAMLRRDRPLHERLGHKLNALRSRWLEAEIAADLGETARAAATFQEVRQEYLEHEIPRGWLDVTLDLAALYARQGEADQVLQLSRQAAQVARSLELETELAQSVWMFVRACREQGEAAELLATLGTIKQRLARLEVE